MPENVLHEGRYNLGFLTASLLPDTARVVAECYLDTGSWDGVRQRVLGTNALQARTSGAGERHERELRGRLKLLTDRQLRLLAASNTEDRTALAWLGALKYSGFIYDFAAESLRDKLTAHDPILRPSDYEGFVEGKTAGHEELTALTTISKAKVRQVLLRMLREAGILSREGEGKTSLGTIRRPVVSPAVRDAVQADNPRWMAGFLVPDTEMGR